MHININGITWAIRR